MVKQLKRFSYLHFAHKMIIGLWLIIIFEHKEPEYGSIQIPGFHLWESRPPAARLLGVSASALAAR